MTRVCDYRSIRAVYRPESTVAALGCFLILVPSAPCAQTPADVPICADRPGLTTAACIEKPNHFQIESGLADWSLERDGPTRTDAVRIADTLLRVGLGDAWEFRAEWSPYVTTRVRKAVETTKYQGNGDLMIGFKKKILDRGSDTRLGPSISLLPSAVLPVGKTPEGSGNWSASLSIPMNYTFPQGWKVQLTPQIAAAVDDDGRGRHLQYGSAIGLQYGVNDTVTVQTSAQIVTERDPDRTQRGTNILCGVSLAVLSGRALQFDLGSNWGLAGHAPELEPYIGLSRHF